MTLKNTVNFIQFLANTGAVPLNQQALHGQGINQVQQQSMGHIQGSGKRELKIHRNKFRKINNISIPLLLVY